jgi:hypothetical protein
MTDPFDALLHDWVVVAEHDGGYVLARCSVCGNEGLLDMAPMEAV